jgi:CRP-like cAMP-binding protein
MAGCSSVTVGRTSDLSRFGREAVSDEEGRTGADLLALVASIAQQVELPEGSMLFQEGRPLNAIYVQLEGRIEMSRGGQPLFTVGHDETIGNWALFDEQPSVVTATVVEQSHLLQIEREDFFELLADHGEITRNLFQALFKRVRGLLTKGLESNSPARPPASS